MSLTISEPKTETATTVADPSSAINSSTASTATASTATDIREDLLRRAFSRENLRWGNLSWPVLGWFAFMHIGCLAAPFFFSWTGVVLCVVMHWLTASIGICLGYHRYLTHQSMKLKSPAEFFVLMCGALSGEGSSFHWTATHRVHHQKSDQKGDPHSPREGAWWSHLLWLFPDQPKDVCQQLYQTYIPDLINRPLVRFFERTYVFWLISPVFVVGAAGWFLDGWFGMLSLVCWGVCARTTFTYHSTWFVNSATHLWGYKNYETRDDSRNLWWVALVSYGEGWHNNHHAHPRLAPAGHRWWEVDVTWWAIRALQLCGQATDVRDNIPHRTVQPAVDVSAKAPKGSPSSSPSPSTKV